MGVPSGTAGLPQASRNSVLTNPGLTLWKSHLLVPSRLASEKSAYGYLDLAADGVQFQSQGFDQSCHSVLRSGVDVHVLHGRYHVTRDAVHVDYVTGHVICSHVSHCLSCAYTQT